MFEDEQKLDLKAARDLQPVDISTNNSSAITIRTVTLSKEINTTLAVLIFLLTAGTYWLLMRYTTTLSNEIILPSELLETNMAAILSSTWPKHCSGSLEETTDRYQFPWVLFYMAKADMEALGSYDVKGQIVFKPPQQSFMVIVKTFSPVMKSLVQIAIWNSVSVWLVLVMIVNTLVYNGFVSNNITNDSIIRLLLVGVYAIANIGHRYYTTKLLYRNFTFVLFQTCWKIICRGFIFLSHADYQHYTKDYRLYLDQPHTDMSDIVWTSFSLELFGTMELSDTYRVLTEADQMGSGGNDKVISAQSADNRRRESHLKARDKTESTFDKFVKPLREAEIKAYEKATDAALEKALANVAVLLGICLATALAPWTSTHSIDATGAQLGSYALILSVSTGLLALVGSITQLTNATESARTLLLLLEKTIEANLIPSLIEDAPLDIRLQDKPAFSLFEGIAGESQLTSSGLWWSTGLLGKLLRLLFGSALMLIPRFTRDRKSFSEDLMELSLAVQDNNFYYISRGPSKRIFRPQVPPTGQELKDLQARQAGEGKDNDNIVESQQENPGRNGNPDTSDAHA